VSDRAAVSVALLDVNETLFSLDPVAERMGEVGLGGQLELWFARVLRDGIAAAAAGRFAAFPDLAAHHLRTILVAQGRPAPAGVVEHVLDGFDHVQAHPDVAPGLRRLRARGIAAVALTNGSERIVTDFLGRSGLRELVDGVHDVAGVRRWKPAPEPYLAVVAEHGVRPGEAALIAVHPWDVLGAQSAGLLGAWLDRDGAGYPPPFGPPDVRGRDLVAVVDALPGPADG
jgi:2-haloacid dehalogenase